MNFPRLILFLGAAFFLLYGLAFALFPAAVSTLVTGDAPSQAAPLVDFRATYGGMTMGVGAVLVYLDRINQVNAGLIGLILVLMLMAATRGIGMLMEGTGNSLMVVFLVAEVASSALAWWALKQNAS